MTKTKVYIKMLLLVALLALPLATRAQIQTSGYYTLTNGHYYWFDGTESDSDDSRYLTAWDSTGWKEIYKLGTHENHSVTEIVEQGTMYLALDTGDYVNPHPATPTITAIATSNGFDPLCVWYRTGATGHYYQEWPSSDGKTYRYYLYATHNDGLSVFRQEVGTQMQKNITWYNWDHGVAIEEVVWRDGRMRSSDFWILYDTLNDLTGAPDPNPVWRMSEVHCYQRPEEMMVRNYRADGTGGNTWDYASPTNPSAGITYYDNVRVGAWNYPAGTAATFMPVQKIDHPRTLTHIVVGMGLRDIEASKDTILYGETLALTAKVNTSISNIIGTTTSPAYTEYVEETYRRGANLNESFRDEEGFGRSGVPTNRHWYYYNNTRNTALPSQESTTLTVDSVTFSLDARASRFVALSAVSYSPSEITTVLPPHEIDSMADEYGMGSMLVDGGYTTPDNSYYGMWSANPANGWIYYWIDDGTLNFHQHLYHTTLTCHNIPMQPTVAYVTATLHFSNNTTQTITDTIVVTGVIHDKTPVAKHAPVVRGSVFGGGKMANVEGNTSVTVHSTDSIYALYGGNDIAGWVQGDEGATVQIGTRYTNAEHPINIGWVYGGGCGFYTYQGINVGQNALGQVVDPYVENGGKSNLLYQAYFFNGKVYKWNSLPSDYEEKANLVVERFNAVANTAPGETPPYTDEEIMAPYYEAAWDDNDLVVDNTFSYIPYYYCDNGNTSVNTNESASNVDNTETGNGSSCMVNKDYMGTIPYVKTSHVSIGVPETEVSGTDGTHIDALGHDAHEHNDHIHIDSLFGGAENAFIGVQSESGDYASAITLDINGGTVLAAFGGNNYGGSVANTATVAVNVHCTKLTNDESLTSNSYYHGYGRDFGIRHLFGGGNLVNSSHSEVQILGGMIDTAFIGGNRATVENPIGIVDCRRAGNSSGYNFKGWDGFNGHFIYTNPSMDTTDGGRNTMANYSADQGLYNVKFLFGGNNLSPMDNLSFLQLHSGSLNSVYGGGNMGDMNHSGPVENVNSPYLDISQLIDKLHHSFDESILITEPLDISAVIAAPASSNIIADYIYGGCRNANVKHSCGLYLEGGNYSDVFGGNDVSGDVGSEQDGSTYVVITGNTVVQGSVYGASDGYYHCEDPDNPGHYDDSKMTNTAYNIDVDYDPYNDFVGALFPTQNHSNVFVHGGLIKGDLVAGGMMADVGFSGDRTPLMKADGTERALNVNAKRGTVRLELSGNAEVRGNVFGGGANASIYGLSQVLVHESPVVHGGLFAGNDCVGQVQSFFPYQSNVDYSGCLSHDDSVAAERLNQAAQVSSNGDSLNVRQDDGTYNPRYSTYVLLEGSPVINSVYGSGNGAWNYDGTRPQFATTFICPDKMNAGSRPNQRSSFIDIHTDGGFIDTVFGGGAGCSVEEAVVVLLNNTAGDNPAYPATLPAGFKGGNANGHNFVGTIFGGNNFDDMYTVPEIRLVQGNVKNVYGGANAGNMMHKTSFEDICGQTVNNVSTHILSETDAVTITDSLFGGCRMSDIVGTAFVDVRKTSADGIRYLYGGNDVSGNVQGSTRIDLSGGSVYRLWGGSNGRYDFVPVGYEQYNVYGFGQYDAAHPDEGLITTASRPNVDTTRVNLWGGEVMASVFAGGSMADCKETFLTVDDEVGCATGGLTTGHLTINGAIYGGGEGRWDDLNARDLEGNRWGNINGSTHVELHHADDVTAAIAYGGGGGGDVYNTYIKTYDTWDSPFQSLFGGCWGSDVHGTAHLEFNGRRLVRNLFGGNDFTGDVYRSEIVVNSGIFNNIYGGGNGDYDDSYYTSQHANALLPEYAYQQADPYAYSGDTVIGGVSVNRKRERPNTEYITLTFNDGTVEGNLYGGGKLGTTMRYQRDATGVYLSDGLGRHYADTSRTRAEAYSDPLQYAYIVTNIHGGWFQNNVFGGASGRTAGNAGNRRPLVYGTKVVNMDDGEIRMSLYGGSESADDGFPAECKDKYGTTLRPSSIINLTGGTVESNLYGAGYLGTTHGSVYVNIGQDAVDSCLAYRQVYPLGATEDSLYHIFKPGAAGGLSPALGTANLMLDHSVYAGANWGAGAGQADFNTPGFRGGESNIYIDGLGYNTGHDELNTLPQMNIAKSLFGSGTSVVGGDVNSRIQLYNYGEMDNCHPTRELESVQRADLFFSHRTAVHYLGATDATSAYISAPYAILRLDTMSFRGYNVAEYDAPISFVKHLFFYEDTLEAGELKKVPVQPLRAVNGGEEACGPTATICGQTAVVSPDDEEKRHTLMLLNNGIDFAVQNEWLADESISTTYYTPGDVSGFGYVATPVGYSSSITALSTAYYWNDDDPSMSGVYSWMDDYEWSDGFSGFVAPCDTVNRYTDERGADPLVWLASDETDYVAEDAEVPYTNYINEDLEFLNYREWKIGKGIRLRETAILAHADPTKLAQDVPVKVGGYDLALAKASIILPATSTGHYYTLDPSGINIKGSTSAVNLVDSTWVTRSGWDALGAAYPGDVSGEGDWATASLSLGGILAGPSNIVSHPDNTFGLALLPGEHFQQDGAGNFVMPAGYSQEQSSLVLSGNAYFNASDSYCSPVVKDGDRVMPTMDFVMTYNPQFNTTFLGTVDFLLNEYDENGVLVGPVMVKAYISTIIEEFRNIETNVLAMFNNGTNNYFTRRVILPITIDENRELYITNVEWVPTDGGGTPQPSGEQFYLTEDEQTITGATPHTVNNLFRLRLIPNDAVTGDLNENLGWTAIDQDTVNLFTLACPSGTAPQKQRSQSLINSEKANGMRVGVLDGRGTAALNVELTFDGSRVYPKVNDYGYIGKAILGLRWVKGENSGNFNLVVNVKTRENGDTIYLATANEVSRDGYTVRPYTDYYSYYNMLMRSGNDDSVAKAPSVIGKSPNCYVQSFQHALSSNVYQEGDVLAIIDTLKIDDGGIHIQGADGPPIQVIRYEGHHHELPSDTGGVYRGPMIVVSGDHSYFTASNIDFHGSAGALVKRVKRNAAGEPILDGSGHQQYTTPKGIPDTNQAHAPIIMIKDGGSVTLSDGAMVRHNWNAYGAAASQHTADGYPVDPSLMGAISVTDGGKLTLSGNVEIGNNLSHTMPLDLAGDALNNELNPGNGAVYINGGYLYLPQSHKSTAVDITHNFLMEPAIHTNPTSVTWWTMAYIDGKPSRYTLDTNIVYNNWRRANVYLTRKQPAFIPAEEASRIAALPAAEQADAIAYYQETHDSQSDNIHVTGVLSPKSRIGVRKWFPGEETRDTIRFAVYNGNDPTTMEKASQNHNFESDDAFRTFYSQQVNNTTTFLFRCATFKHQWVAADHLYVDPVHDAYNLTLASHDVLHFGVRDNVCPSGGDTIIYSVQGGFMPYTYTWSDPSKGETLISKATPYSNAKVQSDLRNTSLSASARTAKYAASMADTLLLPFEEVTSATDRKWNHLRVTVTDATGECKLQKDIDLRIKMDHNTTDYITYLPSTSVNDTASHTGNTAPWQTTVTDGWTDTSRTTKAIASRNFKGVQITPQVWADRSYGTISAVVEGSNNDYIYQFVGESETHELSNLHFCPGDIIYLRTQPSDPNTRFVMWDFDPFYQPLAIYSVPAGDATVTAYYSPTDYWNDVINTPLSGGATESNSFVYGGRPSVPSYTLENEGTTTTEAGFVITYHGDVHIYNENGLAWFISVVNGLNGTQARPFYYNNVYLHDKPGGYDMKKHLWTPVGTVQHRFRGAFIGVTGGETSTTPSLEPILISNIIVDEPEKQHAGFFAFLDSAVVNNIQLQGELIRGSQYVGGLAAQSVHSKVVNCKLLNGTEPNPLDPTPNLNPALAILTTHHTSGGLIGYSESDSIDNCVVAAKYVGDAIYSGGIIGYGISTKLYDNGVRNVNRMSAIYAGGAAGYTDGEWEWDDYPQKRHRRKSVEDKRSHIMNNYIQFVGEANNQRVGGLVGHSKNTLLENNYVYGLLGGQSTEGGVAAILDSGATAVHNYYEHTSSKRSVGQQRANASSTHSSDFSGKGNHVTLSIRDHGVNNLTRALNIWVRNHSDRGFNTWRSDLEDIHDGYPLFGTPDMIPVVDSLLVTGCDSVEWDGVTYLFDDELITHIIDSTTMVDSTFSLRIQVNHSSRNHYTDSITLGNGYNNHGFHLTESDVLMLLRTVGRGHSTSIVLSDTLQNEWGCDSIVTLALTIKEQTDSLPPIVEPTQPKVSVYPNPTISRVTVETTETMSHVELFDNNGRHLQDYFTPNGQNVTIDVSRYSTGAYYLRIHTGDNVTIQKLIKR